MNEKDKKVIKGMMRVPCYNCQGGTRFDCEQCGSRGYIEIQSNPDCEFCFKLPTKYEMLFAAIVWVIAIVIAACLGLFT